MSDASPVYVVGAGGIGLFFAHELEQAGHEVVLCVRSPIEHPILETEGRVETLKARVVTAVDEAGPADWVVLATKAQDTAGAAPWLARLVGPGTRVVAAQNGIDHEDRVRPYAPSAAEIIPALVFAGIEGVGRGRARHHSGTHVDVPAGPGGEALVRLCAGSRLDITLNPDFRTGAWRKLMNNVTGNPITALTLRRGEVLRENDIQDLARGLLHEVVTVACAEGARLGEAEIEDVLSFHARIPHDAGTSMLYDRLAGRPLEHEALTGAVVRAAERHGIAVPLNRAILTLLRALSSPPSRPA